MTTSRATRAWVVVGVAAGLFSLLVLAIDAAKGDACERWRERYEDVRASNGTGTLDYVNVGPLAELRRRRPHGCDIPR